MEAASTETRPLASSGKKRIPRACNACRSAKSRCDEIRPACGRCQASGRECIYVERPRSAEKQRIDELEQEVLSLRQQLQSQSMSLPRPHATSVYAYDLHNPVTVTSPQSTTTGEPLSPIVSADTSLKRKRSHYQIQKEVSIPDFVSEGVLSEQQAMSYFDCFFHGCDRYVPVFDESDAFNSIRLRSSLLLNAICAVGCGVSTESDVDSRTLLVRLKRWLTIVILSPHVHCLETVQALLVMACWMSERNLILAIATRMALELHLDNAFDQLVSVCFKDPYSPQAHALMKRARTWFGLLVLEKILQVDAGNLLGLNLKGLRRCRILLDRPFSTKLDPRLFSQAELNHLRAKINDSLARDQDDVLQAVQDAHIDLDVWYHDWERIMTSSELSGSELPLLIANLTIQKHWADAMAACRAVRATGVHNIDMMSTEQIEVLGLAKKALEDHLNVMLTQPAYISAFRYSMDFVWAKCAFSFLLLLKLTILMPHDSSLDLLHQGRALYHELAKHAGSGSSKVYLRLLQLSIEKYAAQDHLQSTEFDSFVPDEFIFEWDFPGLNLFSSPTGWDLLFDQTMLGDDLFAGIAT